ncbi:flagellar hook-associated protein FlgL [Permianibacter sp. IMCC34836]|uniref:flagellar hook-associated protein FlgL n=1 Tax=Permianibacter fluminis TaxID=2738515 RepID=UPI001556C95E|nr:flagellar hook-associated protein FlgL [Permianibacter fluminis]NQD38062.1 flagellar hook-associated protein FlgL [Permianibacter fluminis]
MRISTPGFFQRGVDSILDQQAAIAKTQLQLSTQKRVLTPSDDPVASTLIETFKGELASLERYKINANTAKGYNEQSDTTLDSVTTALGRVRELILLAGNGAYDSLERNALANEAQERLEELVGIANSQNSEGEYLFAGFRTDVKPFTRNAAGNYQYAGDNGQREIFVNNDVAVGVTHSGFDVFQNIKEGNGDFATFGGALNTGNAAIDPGSVSNRVAFDAAAPQTYTITMVTNALGELAYNVFGSVDGQLIPPLPANSITAAPAYVEDAAITFNGITTSFTGTPIAGDTFTVQNSASKDIFTTVQDAIDAMRLGSSNDADRARLQMALDYSLESLDRGLENISRVRAELGTRLNVIDSELSANEAGKVNAKTTLSSLQDLNVVEAISLFTQQQTSLEAAQSSFARIQGLSLFRFL